MSGKTVSGKMQEANMPGTTTAGQDRPWWLAALLGGPGQLPSVTARAAVTLVIAAGTALMGYSAYIHLYLWGRQPFPYRDVPTIGWLFLLQGIAAIVIGVLVIVTRRAGVVLVGAGFMIVSVAALVIDVEVGMFGFQDSWSVPYATTTLYEEIVGAVLLLGSAVALAWPAVAARGTRR